MRGIKKTILLIFLAISNFVYSQSILGVRFGSSYEDTKKTLGDRFGRYIEEDKGNLTIYEIWELFTLTRELCVFNGKKGAQSFSVLNSKSGVVREMLKV